MTFFHSFSHWTSMVPSPRRSSARWPAASFAASIPSVCRSTASSFSAAIRTVFGAIHDGGATNDVIAIRYLQALEAISDGHANKVFLPMEVTGILGSLGGIAELFKADDVTQHEHPQASPSARPASAPRPPAGPPAPQQQRPATPPAL